MKCRPTCPLSLPSPSVARTAKQTRELEREVNFLEGILPICCFCKKIRDEKSDWQELENYISANSEARFSHSFCPECARKHYGDVLGDFLPKN